MVERHYFKERLLKSFDFTFGFCMPKSKNSVEHIYDFPALTEEESKQFFRIRDRKIFYLTLLKPYFFMKNKLVHQKK